MNAINPLKIYLQEMYEKANKYCNWMKNYVTYLVLSENVYSILSLIRCFILW